MGWVEGRKVSSKKKKKKKAASERYSSSRYVAERKRTARRVLTAGKALEKNTKEILSVRMWLESTKYDRTETKVTCTK